MTLRGSDMAVPAGATAEPARATAEPARVAVVVPLRSLSSGKLRLRPALDDRRRRSLIAEMAETVVRAAHDLPVLVVYDDAEVASWAAQLGAEAARPDEPGLNAAVSFGARRLAQRGYDRIVVAHADLPRARDLRPIAEFDGVTLVPDRLGDGTNVLCVPAGVGFTFAYGPGSFEAHCTIADRLGLPIRIVEDPDLAWDVDHPDDLAPSADRAGAQARETN